MGTRVVRRSGSGARIALIGIGLLALVAAVWFFVLKGENQAQDGAMPSNLTGEAAPEPDASSAPVAPSKNGPVETFEVFAPKDPFTPLVSVAAASGATANSTGSGSTDGTGTSGGTAAGNDIGGHSVKLVDAFAEGGRNRGRVNVDGTVYTVDEGERFAENFELVSVEGSCVTMLFGDDQFTLCEGEEILK